VIRRELALLLAGTLVDCAGLLGTSDERQDVIALICVCETINLDFGGPAACEAELGRRLDGASPNARSAWLDTFVQNNCENCDNAHVCYQTAPTCLSDGLSCKKDSECCAGLTCDQNTGVCG
jgi:hypothetical protein